jgi:gamma-glutamylcyclotransferase (GGCT)/AIG2-like uncharacterized protein YtfP
VYGTLKQGFSNHQVAQRANPIEIIDGELPNFGTMYDVGFYPAVSTVGYSTIYGEIYVFDPKRMQEALVGLDSLEGYRGPNDHGNHYDRIVVDAIDKDGNKHKCYVYVIDDAKYLQRLNVVPSGEWTKKPTYRSMEIFDPQEEEYVDIGREYDFSDFDPEQLEAIVKDLEGKDAAGKLAFENVDEEDWLYRIVDEVYDEVIDPMGRQLRFSDFDNDVTKLYDFASGYGIDLEDQRQAAIFFDELFETEEDENAALEAVGHEPEDIEAFAQEHGDEHGIDWSEYDEWAEEQKRKREQKARGNWLDRLFAKLSGKKS